MSKARQLADFMASASVDGSGNVTFTNAVTAASLNGPLTGNVNGDVTGDVTGNVNGNLTGDVTGNVDATTVDVGSWTFSETGGNLFVVGTSGNAVRVEVDGTVLAKGDVGGYGSI